MNATLDRKATSSDDPRQSPIGNARVVLLAPEEFPTIAAVCERWNAVEQEMKQYLSQVPGDALEQQMTYTSTRGNKWTYALWVWWCTSWSTNPITADG
ncbi:MAG TPA: hypothetical protein VKB88_34160 [Bryobacteraceae bacterium]|nr:hypothetical protein [Bryobacteraceae bacterium]